MKTKIKKFLKDHEDEVNLALFGGGVAVAVWAATYLTMSSQLQVTELITATNPDDENDKRLVVIQRSGRQNWFAFEPGTAA